MTAYSIDTSIKFGPLEVIDVEQLAAERQEQWSNQTLCQVNDTVIRLAVVHGDFHWHKHDKEDEFFYVVEGKWLIDLEDRTVELAPGQGFTVPRGVMHRPRAPVRTVLLVVEPATVRPTGD